MLRERGNAGREGRCSGIMGGRGRETKSGLIITARQKRKGNSKEGEGKWRKEKKGRENGGLGRGVDKQWGREYLSRR